MGALTEAAASLTRRARGRVLTLDIENRPILSYHWGLFDQNIGLRQVKEVGGIMGVGFKWLGVKKTEWVDEWTDRDQMLRTLHAAMSEADIVVTYNGDSFDIKHLNWEFEQAGLGRPKPFRSVDLLKVVRRNFRPMSGKLDHVSEALGYGNKLPTNFDLWVDCMNGDEKARARMARYCKRDVTLTEQLYLRLLPWLSGSANVGVLIGEERACPNCGCADLQDAGTVATQQTQYALYECADCGSWVRTNYIKSRSTIRVAR